MSEQKTSGQNTSEQKISPRYSPAGIEEEIYQQEETKGVFRAGSVNNQAFTVMMPPPNITGSLHMGHAINTIIQDIFVRFYRLQGRDVLWQAGVDHAGIATQIVVEREISKEGLDRFKLGKEKFIDKIWQWYEKSGHIITTQFKRLGASADWSRQRFTLDEGLSKAVTEAFVDLYRKNIIYRDKHLVNWDPHLKTAISDLEVNVEERIGSLWYIKYPLCDAPSEYIIVATTRPETMAGDTAIAVHPEDKRFAGYVGRKCLIPIFNRQIPIIEDEYADPEKGSGAVKITPAHDFNDFKVAMRHGLKILNIFDEEARFNHNLEERWQKIERYQARKMIIKELSELKLLQKEEKISIPIPYADRSKVVIEPRLTVQWFLDAKKLAPKAIEAVKEGKTVFIPSHWQKIYYRWLENIENWCISRQIWWGHVIPAWYAEDGKIFVAKNEAEAQYLAYKHYQRKVKLKRETDVLDTWFSSAIWPFSTLNWPQKTQELGRYYPSDILVTGFDIIFFWVARMMMMGIYFMQDVPFRRVYIHALVRDEKGRKMSKSMNNVIDPLLLIDKYGADALRFSLAYVAVPGRDIHFSENMVKGNRNFVTKIWNVTRFCLLYECRQDENFSPENCQSPVNRWIASELNDLIPKVTQSLEKGRIDQAANSLYQFIWHDFCDWFIEMIKPIIHTSKVAAEATAEKTAKEQECQNTLMAIWEKILLLLYPFMPFITTHSMRILKKDENFLFTKEKYPHPYKNIKKDDEKAEQTRLAIKMITAIRTLKGEIRLPLQQKLSLLFTDERMKDIIEEHKRQICEIAKISHISLAKKPPQNAIAIAAEGFHLYIETGKELDINEQKKRLQKEIDNAQQEIESCRKKLQNNRFLENASREVILKHEDKYRLATDTLKRLNTTIARLQ